MARTLSTPDDQPVVGSPTSTSVRIHAAGAAGAATPTPSQRSWLPWPWPRCVGPHTLRRPPRPRTCDDAPTPATASRYCRARLPTGRRAQQLCSRQRLVDNWLLPLVCVQAPQLLTSLVATTHSAAILTTQTVQRWRYEAAYGSSREERLRKGASARISHQRRRVTLGYTPSAECDGVERSASGGRRRVDPTRKPDCACSRRGQHLGGDSWPSSPGRRRTQS